MLTVDDLNEEQKEVYDRICDGESLFITGAAGTGKSAIINVFLEENNRKEVTDPTKKTVQVCAPTGIAAAKCGGQTLHQTFRIYGNERGVFARSEVGKQVGWLCVVDILIIDEISMCRIDLFEYIMKSLFITGLLNIQIICVGDFLQLPPILDMRREEGQQYIAEWGELLYAFQSEFWNSLHPVVLKEVFRTDDHGYIHHLNRIRIGDKSAVDFFNRNCVSEQDPEAITVCARNDDAHRINELRVANHMSLSSEEIKVYGAVFSDNYSRWLSVPVSEEIALYTGMRVMTVKNDSDLHLVNGEIGIVEEMRETSIVVRFSNRSLEISYYLWSKPDVEGNTIIFSQLPIQQAEAISIHKSQGQTFDRVNVNPYAFAAGQLYVALSRCRSIEGMHLLNVIDSDQLRVSPIVLQYYEGINGLDVEEDLHEEPDQITEESDFDRGKWKCVNVKERVGFDKVLVALKVTSFDGQRFINRIREHTEDDIFACIFKEPSQTIPFLHYEEITVPYSYIRMEIGVNSLVMKKNPTGHGEDVCILTLHVPPIQEHEELGNITNLSVEEEQNYVRNIMRYIEEMYGIGFDEYTATIRSAEININLRGGYIAPHWGHFFVDNYNALKGVRPYIGKEFSKGGYNRSKEDIPAFRYRGRKDESIQDMINLGKRHLKSPDILFDENNNLSLYTPGSRPISLICRSDTRVFKAYDKKFETKEQTKRTGQTIIGMTELTRIEFEIKKSKTIRTYMGNDNLFALRQEDIENAYHRLSLNLVKKPMERFKDRNEDQLKALFRSVKNGRGKWVQNLVISMLRLAYQEDIYMDLSWNRLKALVAEIPKQVVKTNRTYACNRLFKEIEKLDGNGIRVAEEGKMPYTNQLVRLMMTIEGEKDQKIYYSNENIQIDKEDYIAFNYVRDRELMDYNVEEARREEKREKDYHLKYGTDEWEIYDAEMNEQFKREEEEAEEEMVRRTGIDMDW